MVGPFRDSSPESLRGSVDLPQISVDLVIVRAGIHSYHGSSTAEAPRFDRSWISFTVVNSGQELAK